MPDHDVLSPPDPPLADAVVTLRPFGPDDVAAVVAACADPEIPRWIPMIPSPYTEADGRRYVLLTHENWQDGTSAEFAIVDRASELVVGSIGLHLGGGRHRAAVGYWVAREARGRGIATRALRLVARWALERLGVERLGLWTLPGNRASQIVAERAGFRYEGVMRAWDVDRDGRPVDCVMFSLTPEDLADLDRESGDAAALAPTPPELHAPGTRAAPFVDLLGVAELPEGAMRRLTLAGIDLLVAHTPAGIVVTDDRCPHMAAPLSIGSLDGCVVGCPLHEGRFDLCTGETVQMPTTGGLDADGEYHGPWSPTGSGPKSEPPSKKLEARRLTRVHRLRYYPTRVRDGRLEARLPFVPE